MLFRLFLNKFTRSGKTLGPFVLTRCVRRPENSRLSHDFLSVNTKPTNDVILYKYENPRYFTLLNIFAMSQFALWLYLGHFSATFLRDLPSQVVAQDAERQRWWWQKWKLSDPKVFYGLSIFSVFFANMMIVFAWTHTLRSVRYLILRKGGSRVSFVTYTPFGENRIMDVPLSRVSAVESRRTARAYVPIKVQGKRFYYLLDSKGEFLNGALFDVTAGLQRTFKGS